MHLFSIRNEKPADVTVSILFIYRLDLYRLRAHRPILRRIHAAVPTTIGSVSVPFWSRVLYVVAGLGDCTPAHVAI